MTPLKFLKISAPVLFFNLALFLALWAVMELGWRIYVATRPAYDVLFLQPDRAVGWKQVPNLKWIWGGIHWYGRDFSVPIQTNSLGFRDMEHTIEKPENVIRIALLGDSLIEAVQVPFKKTAGHLLEKKLNALRPVIGPKGHRLRYEVLNFGVSNYSVGQYLLVWENYVRQYRPDFVFIFVAGFHMSRTIWKYEGGAFQSTRGQQLWIRPTFRLENGRLIAEPARDYEVLVKVQKELIEKEFGGKFMRKRRPLTLVEMLIENIKTRQQKAAEEKKQEKQDITPHEPAGIKEPPLLEMSEETCQLNLKIIEELGSQVRETGGQLVIFDLIKFFRESSMPFALSMKAEAQRQGLGYVPLSDYLLEATKKDIDIQWRHDSHFNKTGNKILAEVMFDWLKENGSKNPRPESLNPKTGS
ncbi:MAG: hypothetical protein NC930_00350 [Candidatus Omnitrophica bacterium]|nr:hypothetical protein [Candidatus Omnitrophota bacterium]